MSQIKSDVNKLALTFADAVDDGAGWSSTGPPGYQRRGRFQIVTFPQRWMEPGDRRGQLITTKELEIRQDPSASNTELLFGARSLESHATAGISTQ